MSQISPFSLSLNQAARWGTVVLALILAGCSSTPERQSVPREYTLKAGIPGIPVARSWGDEWPKFAAEKFDTYTDADFRREFGGIYDKPHNYLAISGGGAYGAGLLVGWSATGERPEFTMVTGVSTGALTAPFALNPIASAFI